MSHYETLGVPRDASADDVKRAFRRAAKHAHPDRAGGSHERMQALNRAYEVLGDPERRADYDAGGSGGQRGDPLAEARSKLASLFAEVLERAPDETDPVAHLAKELHGNIQRMLGASADMRAAAAKFRKRAARIRSKGEGENLLAGVALSMAAKAEAALASQGAEITLVNQMQAMLGDFSYELTEAEKLEAELQRQERERPGWGMMAGGAMVDIDKIMMESFRSVFKGARGGPGL